MCTHFLVVSCEQGDNCAGVCRSEALSGPEVSGTKQEEAWARQIAGHPTQGKALSSPILSEDS